MAKTKTSNTANEVPHPMLQALVAQFLEQNGFKSAHRIFNTERKKRPKKEGWEATFAKNYTAKFPPLESIFQSWKGEHGKVQDSTSDSEEDTSLISSDNESTSDQSNTSSDSDKGVSGSNQSDSSSDSGTDDEANTDMDEADSHIAIISKKTSSQRNSLKRKARESSSSSSDSASAEDKTSESESGSDEEKPNKKRRVKSPTTSSVSSSDSDTDSSSGSESDAASELLHVAKATELPLSSDSSSSGESSDESSASESSSSDDDDTDSEVTPALNQAASDSSGTVIGDLKPTQAAHDSSSSEGVADVSQRVDGKKKHTGARPTKLAAMSANADLDDYVSNTYVSYEYADKAFRDLSVTRGKGFTKEKNKKKRGSYRGGAIDISGGKAFKFDD